MSVKNLVLFFSLLLPSSALACDIEDCSLPASLHHIHGAATPTNGIWTWLHHDLALARQALHSGRDARALNLAHSLDHVIRGRLNDLVSFSGREALLDFHYALQAVVQEAGGWPLAEIEVGGKEA